mmetsp:Transcript_7085/g.14217  ORF Transcript_7085/g.14217 Transcript_7085/m.14217 type:complete len:234 (-) Transcript_7085:273-974(-)
MNVFPNIEFFAQHSVNASQVPHPLLPPSPPQNQRGSRQYAKRSERNSHLVMQFVVHPLLGEVLVMFHLLLQLEARPGAKGVKIKLDLFIGIFGQLREFLDERVREGGSLRVVQEKVVQFVSFFVLAVKVSFVGAVVSLSPRVAVAPTIAAIFAHSKPPPDFPLLLFLLLLHLAPLLPPFLGQQIGRRRGRRASRGFFQLRAVVAVLVEEVEEHAGYARFDGQIGWHLLEVVAA